MSDVFLSCRISISVTALALLLCAPLVFAQAPLSIQQSHIEANVPADKDFHAFLQRDVLAFLKAREASVDDLQIELLRNVPTQSGVAYPKYYAWVKFRRGAMKIEQGALRLAAVDKLRFEVIGFVSAAQVRADRQAVENVFPQALVSGIVARAAQP